MGVRAHWMADAAMLTGYPVNEQRGWRGRGHGDFRVIEGVVGHHTAGPKSGNYPSLLVVRDGRAGLEGPLSNYGLGRDGTIFCIADGVSWHAGASSWSGFRDLNDEFIGIEAESVGTSDDWTPEQRDAYPRLVASILFYIRRDATRFAGHKEACLPRGRKIDPAFWNLNGFRDHVSWLLRDPLRRIPRFANPPTPPRPRPREDDAMYIKTVPDKSKPTEVWCGILSGFNFVGLGRSETPSDEQIRAGGGTVQWVEWGTWQEFDRRSHVMLGDIQPRVNTIK